MIWTWLASLLERIGTEDSGPGDEGRDELALLRLRRSRLQELARTYRDFGFHTMADESEQSILVLDEEIHHLKEVLKWTRGPGLRDSTWRRGMKSNPPSIVEGRPEARHVFKCPQLNCGREVTVISQIEGAAPTCSCGTPMKPWPRAAIETDQFNDL